MKISKLIITTTLIATCFSSCIKEEGLNREADIKSFNLPSDVMLMPSIINQKGDNRVIITVYDTTGLSNGKVAPEIVLSEGATITPASKEEVTLKDYQALYVVTAEDGGKKEYRLIIEPDKPQKYNFESWYEVANTAGTRVYEMLTDPLWSNANQGVATLYRDGDLFPTRSTEESYSGKYGMLLETVFGNRNKWLLAMDIPLYAGSAFRGYFDFSAGLSNPLACAKFGQIHPKSTGKPTRLTGWYKYKSGEYYQTCTVVKNKNRIDTIQGRIDEPDIYAVYFKVPAGNDGKNIYLTAENVLTSDRIIAKAIIDDRTEKADWTNFDIPFVYSEEPDYSQFDYKLAIVFSSSRQGAFYEGAIGSLLHIDEVEVITEPF